MFRKEKVTKEQKEMCAVLVMKMMLTDWSEQSGRNFTELFLTFTKSKTYRQLFDFKTGLWREGPDYLFDFYMAEKKIS